jgi:tagatose-1,6-bisphosphate aldolase non-catalytic subunit AgaZ/GatZ
VAVMLLSGCVTTRQLSFDESLTKQKLQEWRKPNKIYYNPGKYNADEMWIYEYPDSNQIRYYFKDGKVVNAEEIVFENL